EDPSWTSRETRTEDNLAGIDHCTTAGTTTDRNTMIEYLKTTGKRFLSPKKYRIRLKEGLLTWGQCTSPHCHRYQGVPDPVEPVKQSPTHPT
ncbi:Uncharacterized protein FKW44_006780, partial [Caligus rogercresseyi]